MVDEHDTAAEAPFSRAFGPSAGAGSSLSQAPLLRSFLWATAAACVGGLLLLLATMMSATVAQVTAVGFGLMALLSAAATRLPAASLRGALSVIHVMLLGVILASSLALGWGLDAPAWPLLGLMVFGLCAAAGWQAATLLAVLSAIAIVAVGLAAPGDAAGGPPQAPSDLRLGVLLLELATGLAGGALLWHRLGVSRRTADEREERFRRLLALSADGYWELDARYRLLAGVDHTRTLRPLSESSGLGQVPWDLPAWYSDADTLDALQADLDGRQPFRDMPLRWTLPGVDPRHFLASGEPRFDKRGIFSGYWGVVRDVTSEQQAQVALVATETRYRELFSRIPSPLVLHRSGHVIEANAAALALFDQPDLGSMVGWDLLSSFESGDSRERARRLIEMLHGQPLGTALPAADFKLALPGRRVAVRATSVRVDAEGGPATLAIFVDDTERLAAEEALRRSEAMLSHLVATSPDLITLTDVSTGRYAMVNRSFERYSGWTAAEAVGRTAHELGVWGSSGARDEFVHMLRTEGAVTDMPVPFLNKGGQVFSMVVSAAIFVLDHRDYMVINARDVTEKERERLEREAILLNASIGIAVTHGHQMVLVNRHFERMFDLTAQELIGQPTSLLWAPETERESQREAVSAALARGAPVEVERLARRKDGSTFMARISGRAVDPAHPGDGGAIWIVEDVTERRQFEQALARARDDAEAANRAKSAFLANTSHELRTPLNGLIGLARLAREDDVGPERRTQYLEQIEHSAQSLAAIISDILDLSRIEAGKLPIESAPFDLSAELRSLQQASSVLAEGHGLVLHLDLDDSVRGAVRGDALRVRQIVNNYLVNAIKFTSSGSIWLRARRLAAPQALRVRIEVQDTGVGIAPATLARLFKPFTQADESTTRRFGGTGLGLSICHELAALMGGRVGAESREGQGSLFWAELPLPPLPAAAPGPEEPRLPQRRLPGLRVLLAEDNAVNMMIAVAMLERWGVEVTQAHDGREAVAAVQRAAAAGQPFHAVLMDVQMPVMSGHEATRALRELEAQGGLQMPQSAGTGDALAAQPPLPIIALTAAALVTERDEALRAGMNAFLTKPVDADKLYAALLRCVPGAR